MKIVASIFLLPLTFLTLQPLFSSRQKATKMMCCGKMMKCHKQKQQPDKENKCERSGCNPFMACASGNFYNIDKDIIDYLIKGSKIEKITAINDNRLASSLSECWHPPELG